MCCFFKVCTSKCLKQSTKRANFVALFFPYFLYFLFFLLHIFLMKDIKFFAKIIFFFLFEVKSSSPSIFSCVVYPWDRLFASPFSVIVVKLFCFVINSSKSRRKSFYIQTKSFSFT